MKTTLTSGTTWYPLNPHTNQAKWKRCALQNKSSDIITISQRGGSAPTPSAGVSADNMGFPIDPGQTLILPTQEVLWAACVTPAQTIHYEYFN